MKRNNSTELSSYSLLIVAVKMLPRPPRPPNRISPGSSGPSKGNQDLWGSMGLPIGPSEECICIVWLDCNKIYVDVVTLDFRSCGTLCRLRQESGAWALPERGMLACWALTDCAWPLSMCWCQNQSIHRAIGDLACFVGIWEVNNWWYHQVIAIIEVWIFGKGRWFQLRVVWGPLLFVKLLAFPESHENAKRDK